MEITVREFSKIEAAANLIWNLIWDQEETDPTFRAVRAGVNMILDELHLIRMREAENMNEWGEGELEEGMTDAERGALKLARAIKARKPQRLPDVPDWRDGAARQDADDKLTRIRLTVAAHQGESLSDIIEAILADGTDLKTLAKILGVNKARISEAKHGHARPGFVARFCEVLGEGTDSANCRTGRTSRTGRTNAGTGVTANCRGKRGAK